MPCYNFFRIDSYRGNGHQDDQPIRQFTYDNCRRKGNNHNTCICFLNKLQDNLFQKRVAEISNRIANKTVTREEALIITKITLECR